MIESFMTSAALLGLPILSGLIALIGVVDVNWGKSKERFESIDRNLRKRKVSRWRTIISGVDERGEEITVNDDYLESILNDLEKIEHTKKTLYFVRKIFSYYYHILFVILMLGILHLLIDILDLIPSMIQFTNENQATITIFAFIFIIGGLWFLFTLKNKLEVKYGEISV